MSESFVYGHTNNPAGVCYSRRGTARSSPNSEGPQELAPFIDGRCHCPRLSKLSERTAEDSSWRFASEKIRLQQLYLDLQSRVTEVGQRCQQAASVLEDGRPRKPGVSVDGTAFFQYLKSLSQPFFSAAQHSTRACVSSFYSLQFTASIDASLVREQSGNDLACRKEHLEPGRSLKFKSRIVRRGTLLQALSLSLFTTLSIPYSACPSQRSLGAIRILGYHLSLRFAPNACGGGLP
ncbi:hypothetical protein C8R47DRAFT_735659 [Mycena vitilis]|nr:hypothetical protein C8R47DRAFT_735659 [Mycena vitilis]